MQNTVWRRILSTAVFVLAATGVGLGQARRVNIATDATDTLNSGDTEPSIAVNPTNPNEVVVVSFSGNWTPTQMAPVWKSSDGGLTWRRVPQIPQPQAGLSGPGDQKVAFDSSGRLHVAELGVNSSSANFDFIFRQTGAADAALTAGASFGDDQPHLDVDQSLRHVRRPPLLTMAQLRRRQRAIDGRQLRGPRREHHQCRGGQQLVVPEPHQPHCRRTKRPRLSHLQDA